MAIPEWAKPIEKTGVPELAKPVEKISVPEWAKPITKEEKEKGILETVFGEEYIRPALEMGGMLTGGALGTGLSPAGTVVGGGLGYAAGKRVADIIYEEPGTLPQELKETGIDILTGTAMEAGGGILGKTLSAISKAGGSGIRNMLGKVTGTGTGAIEEAVESGVRTGITKTPFKSVTAFDKALRGEVTGQEIASHATSALQSLKDLRGAAYLKELKKIKLDPTIQRGVAQRYSNKVMNLISKEKYDIKPVTDRNGKIVDFDFSESTLVESQPVIGKALKDLARWDDYSASGLDILKKRLSQYAGQVKRGTPQESFLTRLKTSLSDELNIAVPQYEKMTKGYSEATTLIKDIESGLMLRKQGMTGRITADQTLRRLVSSMKDNFELRRDLVKALEHSRVDLSGEIAGYSMNALTPRGLAGSGPALIGSGALAFVNPKMWPVIAASSPRLSGEFLRLFGKGLAETKGAAPKIGRLTAYQIKNKLTQ